ncbi:MAG: DUF5688 family protein [Lachnospiraceae bacterium]|nr:DUF5688 family protein [Lachnospiraceae bacterium]
MMNYEEFKEKVEEEFKEFLGEPFKDETAVIKNIPVINGTKDYITLESDNMPQYSCYSIPADEVYEAYLFTRDFDYCMNKIGREYRIMKEDNVSIINLELLKSNVILTLINTEFNKKLLEIVPHREFEDLSVIYLIRNMEYPICESHYSPYVSNELAKKYNLSEEELFELAKENTDKLTHIRIEREDQLFRTIGVSEEKIEHFMKDIDNEKMMYSIRNVDGLFATGAMLYAEKFHLLAETLDRDLYIFPSSIHELIAISQKSDTLEAHVKTVHEVNIENVDLNERLSNSVYKYDRATRKVSIAYKSDIPITE